ncbi:MAG: type VI secretion system amidase effector protein Tae4 [Flavobacterium sp.]|nr:type VI secretion system amidase effector protein Tae4 [Flavobacterium sp.]
MKKRFSLVYLFLLFILTFNSCQTEENIIKSESSSNNRFTTKRISLSEITNSEVSSKISRLQERNQINYTSKVVYDSINNFYIDTDYGMYIMDENGVESYTFPIYSENSVDSLENLVIMVYPEGDTKVFIADYDKTFTEINNMSQSEINDYSVNFTEIDLENGTETQRFICLDFWEWKPIECKEGDNEGGGEFHCWGWTFIGSTCVEAGGGGSDGGTGTGGTGTGTGSGTGSGSGPGGGSTGTGGTGSGSSTGSNGSILTTPLDDSDLGITYYQIERQKWLNTQFNWQQNIFLNNNPNAENSIFEYLESTITANDQTTYSLENVEFAVWTVEYLMNNLDVTLEQFENWFMGESEGQDGEYDADYWENPVLTFPQQNLPSWENFEAAFPKDTDPLYDSPEKMYNSLGGTIATFYSGPNTNTCAIRLSKALNYSGVNIPHIQGKTFSGADGKYYFKAAYEINLWMRKTFGTNPATSTTPYNPNHFQISGTQAGQYGQNLPALLNGKKGIYSIYSSNFSWASGHADLLYPNSNCANNCHFGDAPIYRLDVWELN